MASASSHRFLPETIQAEEDYLLLKRDLSDLRRDFELADTAHLVNCDNTKREIEKEYQKDRLLIAPQLVGQARVRAEQLLIEHKTMKLEKVDFEYRTSRARRLADYDARRLTRTDQWTNGFRRNIASAEPATEAAWPRRESATAGYTFTAPPATALSQHRPANNERVFLAPPAVQVPSLPLRQAPILRSQRLEDFTEKRHEGFTPENAMPVELPLLQPSQQGPKPSEHGPQVPKDVDVSMEETPQSSDGHRRQDLLIDTDRATGSAAVPSTQPERKAENRAPLTQEPKRKAEDRIPLPSSAKRPKLGGPQDDPSTPQSKTQPGRRTISFDEVYQDAKAVYKHLIVEHPPNSGAFYILKCDEHGVHFNQHPLAGAAKHLHSSQHGNLSKEYSLALDYLGFLVYDCNAELAKKNNEFVMKSYESGYKPLNMNQLSKSGKATASKHLAASSPQSASFLIESPAPKHGKSGKNFRPAKKPVGVSNATPGMVYLAYWPQEKKNYAVLLLPWGDLAVAGMQGTLSDTGLLNKAPKCYVVNRKYGEIVGWTKGYEDGGPHVWKREFAVMYFDDKHSVGWTQATRLSPFIFDDPDWQSIPNWQEAADHYAGLRGYKDLADMKAKDGVPKPGACGSVNMDGTKPASRIADEDGSAPASGEPKRSPRKMHGKAAPRGPIRVPDASTDMDDSADEELAMSSAMDLDGSDDSDDDSLRDQAMTDFGDDAEASPYSRRTSVSKDAREAGAREEADPNKQTSTAAPNGSPSEADSVSVGASTAAQRYRARPNGATTGNATDAGEGGTESASGGNAPIGPIGSNTGSPSRQPTPPDSAADVIKVSVAGAIIGRDDDAPPAPPVNRTLAAVAGQTPPASREPSVSSADMGHSQFQSAVQSRDPSPNASRKPSEAPAQNGFSAINATPGASESGLRMPPANQAELASFPSLQTPRNPPPSAAQQQSQRARTPPLRRVALEQAEGRAATEEQSRQSTPRPQEGQRVSSPAPSVKSNSSQTTLVNQAASPAARPSPFAPRSANAAGRRGDVFALFRYSDDSGKVFESKTPGEYLRIVVDKETGTASTAPDAPIAVVIEPKPIRRVTVEPLEDSCCMVLVLMKDGYDIKEQTLVFEATDASGRGAESGRIQARHFCRWVLSVDPSTEYRNNTNNGSNVVSSRRPQGTPTASTPMAKPELPATTTPATPGSGSV